MAAGGPAANINQLDLGVLSVLGDHEDRLGVPADRAVDPLPGHSRIIAEIPVQIDPLELLCVNTVHCVLCPAVPGHDQLEIAAFSAAGKSQLRVDHAGLEDALAFRAESDRDLAPPVLSLLFL